jgi:hypothetical protein
MREFTVLLQGTSALLQHNIQMADPSCHWTKLAKDNSAIKGAKRTEAVEAEMTKIKFLGSLYIDKTYGPYVPATWLKGSFSQAGKSRRLGQTIKTSVMFNDESFPLAYDGPRTPEGLYDEIENFSHFAMVNVGTGGAKKMVPCTRPMFRNWSLEATGVFDEESLDEDDFQWSIERAGMVIGIGDWRAEKGGTFGRYEAKVTL